MDAYYIRPISCMTSILLLANDVVLKKEWREAI
jgi:hypothetical protein